MNLKCDGVFEGGGVKGIGFIGAMTAIENAGYEFENIVGTSAGAIVASLIAAGYGAKELKKEMDNFDYKLLKQDTFFNKFYIGKIINIIRHYGIYNPDLFESWIQSLLLKKGKTLFKHIRTEYDDVKYKYKFQAIASDLTDKKMLILPRDLENFGIDPDEFPISKAVRMSISIPVFFEPTYLNDINGKKHLIVDGGLLSNYPIWLLDDGTSNPPWPTFGFKFINSKPLDSKDLIKNFIDYTRSVASTLLEAHDNLHISKSKGDFQRTINIPTEICLDNKCKFIYSTYFDITEDEEYALFNNGFEAGKNFLNKWDFNEWKKKYRA